jgi:hypothetical protein
VVKALKGTDVSKEDSAELNFITSVINFAIIISPLF